ncbi:MAG: rane fusion protein multidrug efflux system, partial [Thermodesulfobacteriota bacterium]|nr:rane fusion protein multidrug efflux system [Thermodesulfobacteriota bacterium]
MYIRNLSYAFIGCLIFWGAISLGAATEVQAPVWLSDPPPAASRIVHDKSGASREKLPAIEATIINAFRTANVGTDVGGIIESFKFDEGDRVGEGDVVVQLFRDRYEFEARRVTEKVRGLEALLEVADQEARAREELLKMESATRLEVLKAQQQFASLQANLAEARVELNKATYDLQACTVKAPFTGYIAARLKQPYETA